MSEIRMKTKFLEWVRATHDEEIARRTEDILKESDPTEQDLWAALDVARAAYERELRGPVNTSLMRFCSRVRL